MSALAEPGCKFCEESASGVCTKHNEHGRGMTVERARPTVTKEIVDLHNRIFVGNTWVQQLDGLADAQIAAYRRGIDEVKRVSVLAKEIENLATKGWLDKANAEFLFTEITNRARGIQAYLAAAKAGLR